MLCISISTTRAGEWEVAISPKAGDNFQCAAFRLWIDDAMREPRALLVLLPGWNGDGRNLVRDSIWRRWARERDLGVVGVFFQSAEEDAPYDIVERGSGEALLAALGKLTRQSGRASVTDAPLLIWGHSAGGQFAYGFACFRPERVVAFAALKGGRYESSFDSGVRTVPALFVVGEHDAPLRAIFITKLFEENRSAGAPWCLAFETGAGHEIGRTRELVLPFFDGVLAMRFEPGAGRTALRPVDARRGWLGTRATLAIELAARAERSADDVARTVWLPDEQAARAWQAISLGEVLPGKNLRR